MGAVAAQLTGAGEIRNKTVWCQQRRLPGWAVVYLIAGGGSFTDALTPRRRICAGDLLLLSPGIVHSYGPEVGDDWHEVWLMFEGAVFTTLQAGGLLATAHPVWHPGVQPALVAAFRELEVARQAGGVAEVLGAQVHLLLARLAAACVHQPGREPEWLTAACAALAADLGRPLDLQAVARSSGFSYERFRKQFTAATGLPPARWRLERRIDQAKNLLMAGADLAETAEALGFCDAYFFNRQFRQVVGMAPGRFRGGAQRRG